MRVLFACDAIGTASPPDAAEQLARGWTRTAPHVQVATLPQSNGSAGFLAALARRAGAHEEPLPVDGQLASAVVLADGTLVVEAAQVAAVPAVPTGSAVPHGDELSTAERSSYAVGRLLVAAEALAGVRRCVVGVGDLRCLDGGLGMLQALAQRPEAPGELDLSWVREVRASRRGTPTVVATANSLPLLGFHGAAVHAEDVLGLSRARSQIIEGDLGRYIDATRKAIPPRRDLMTGKDRRLDREPGAGAGGGVAFGLALVGAQIRPGARVCAEISALEEAVGAADLVVIGADIFDWRQLQDSVLAEVGAAAARQGRPVVVLATEAHVGRRESAALGVSGVYASVPPGRRAADVEVAMSLEDLAARVAATWTPR